MPIDVSQIYHVTLGRSRFDGLAGEMVRTDLFYIENWSLWLDVKIILLTLPAVFRGDGAR